jgi:hypothetical protein
MVEEFCYVHWIKDIEIAATRGGFMSDPDSSRQQPQTKPQTTWLLLVCLLLAIAVGAFLATRRFNRQGGEPRDSDAGTGAGDPIAEQLELTRQALAATENLEMAQADGWWSQLLQQSPQDVSIALNRALHRVLRVDQLSAQATNTSLDEAARRAARQQLSADGISGAREAIDDFAKLAADPVLAMWLRTRVDLQEASLLPGSMTKSLRRKVYDQLAEAITGEIGKRPSAIILGGTLMQVVEQMEDPIDGLSEDVLKSATRSISALSDQHADNLYFALRAARLNIAGQNKEASRFVQRGNELARAIEPSIRRETQPIGVTPDQLVAQIVDAIEAGKWDEADNRMLLWFNVLNSTEIVKTDRRRASPHPLDQLSFDSLRRLSAEMVRKKPLDRGSAEFAFTPSPLAGSAGATLLQTIDFDLDLDPDLVSVTDDGTLQLWSNDGAGGWSLAGQLKLDMQPTGLLVADMFLVDSSDPDRLRASHGADAGADVAASGAEPDYGAAVRHNTFQNLVAFGTAGVRLIRVDGRESATPQGRLQLVDSTSGLEDVGEVTAAVAGDLDADGDLDVVLATRETGIRLFANRGNRTFFEVPRGDQPSPAEDPVTGLAIADLDRDLDLDVVTVRAEGGRVGMLENLLHLQFRERLFAEIVSVPGASTIAAEDLDGNVSWDLIVGGSGGTAIVFSQTADAGAWTVERVETSDQPASHSITADFDNDSWMEVLAIDSQQASICRVGPWGLGPWQPLAGTASPGSLVVADFDRDGLPDVSAIQDGQVSVLNNRSAAPGHHLDVRFKGIDDNATGRVNHFAIGSVLELRFGPHYRARIVTSPATHFGTDGFVKASSIRAILPNGLTQTIRDPNIDSLVEEEQTLKGSCPYLYAWDGEKFVFQTDCLWAAPLGLQVARGVVAQDRPWEYLKLDGTHIKPRGDRYEFRITEELWEVAYFDKLALSVVDHPSDVEVWTNEKVGPAEIALPTIFAFASGDLRPLRKAIDTSGRDVTAKLAAADRDFVQGFDRRLRQGLCPPHWIDLDFGDDVSQHVGSSKIYLVLTGWILPTDTSLNIQIDQNPDLGPIEFPSVWVPDAAEAGGWRTAIPFMGFPGGKTKTIVVDLSQVLRADDPRVRIRTSAQIYWDSARLAIQSQPAEFRSEPLRLLSAEVAFHGFSQAIRQDATQPETYDYQRSSTTPRWPPLAGQLTRFGDCTELVQDWDDAMVVISSGDELQVEFSLPAADLPAGWQRDFVLHSIGWDKDADLNTLSGQSIGPLPYREMTAYPPPAGDEARTQRLEELNRPHRQRSQLFRSFWYRAGSAETARFLNLSQL